MAQLFNPDARINRRQFLRQVESAAAVVACTALPLVVAGCAGNVRYVTPTLRQNQLVVYVSQLPASGGALVEDPRSELPIYLHRSSDGGYTAVSTRCTHRGCEVEPGADKLVCPCHGSEFDLAGLVLEGPAERPLARFRVTADANAVVIHLNTQDTP